MGPVVLADRAAFPGIQDETEARKSSPGLVQAVGGARSVWRLGCKRCSVFGIRWQEKRPINKLERMHRLRFLSPLARWAS